MLLIDDNNFRLARMQESLLKVATGDRSYHLDNYIKNVKVIDAKAFDELVNIMKDVRSYNQSLEEELEYLENVKKSYDQVVELQMRFRTVCEENGGGELTLSDMSSLNIEYVENRMSVISGYLTNIKNIEKNKKKLEELNDKLINEEKKREFLNKKIKLFEKKLRDDFVHAKLKQIVFGKLESYDISLEYEKLGYNLISLVDHPDELDEEYKKIDAQCAEVNEKYEAVKLCYNNLFSHDSKSMMGEAEREYYLAKYKYIMLKILKLLMNDVETYDLAKVKRENFVELVNNRNVCLDKLGMRNPLNIVSLVDIDGQMKEISVLSECINTIHSIRKEIVDVTMRTEDMVNENNNYLIALTDTKELIQSKVSMSDVDITTFEDIVLDEVKSKKKILDNQVIGVKSISSSFKLILSKQKANGVIERIYQMNFGKKNTPKPNIVLEDVVPELVVGPKEEIIEETPVLEGTVDDTMSFEEVLALEPVDSIFMDNNDNHEVIFEDNSANIDTIPNNDMVAAIDDSLFETTTPFEAPVMFLDRTDSVEAVQEIVFPQEEVVEVKEEEISLPAIDNSTSQDDLMPDAFWVTDNNSMVNKEEEEEKVVPSFDDQINALLAETKENINVKRKVI